MRFLVNFCYFRCSEIKDVSVCRFQRESRMLKVQLDSGSLSFMARRTKRRRYGRLVIYE